MAVDTLDKRASAINVTLTMRVWPNPDNSLAITGDRMHIAYCYRGIQTATVGFGWCMAGQIFCPGAQSGQVFTPTAQQGQTFTPTAQQAQIGGN